MSTSEHLTLQDLGPVKTPDFQNQIGFDIVTFEIGLDHVPSLNEAIKSFNTKNITFQNQTLYATNGITVGQGKAQRGSELVRHLSSVGAVRIARKVLTTLDQTSELFATITLPEQRYIFFTTTTQISKAFDAGHLGWMIKPKLTSRADTIQLQVTPAYVPLIKLRLPQPDKQDDYHATYVPPGKFDCTLEQGDFLILAPARVPTNTTIDAVLFNTEQTEGKIHLYILIFAAAEH
ncbi:MAG: hypothetical protein ABFD91_13080 [Anaerohalosphaeraceae bacterium]